MKKAQEHLLKHDHNSEYGVIDASQHLEFDYLFANNCSSYHVGKH